jgi:hypothetical protein
LYNKSIGLCSGLTGHSYDYYKAKWHDSKQKQFIYLFVLFLLQRNVETTHISFSFSSLTLDMHVTQTTNLAILLIPASIWLHFLATKMNHQLQTRVGKPHLQSPHHPCIQSFPVFHV